MGVYNPQDYFIYIGILLVLLTFALKFLFNKIKIDKTFIVAISPYMILAIAIRVLTDVGFYERSKLWNITPGVYVITFILAFFMILIGYQLEKRDILSYWKLTFAVGFIGMLYFLYNLIPFFNHPLRILVPLSMATIITLAVYIISPLFYKPIKEFENIAILFGHLLDGCATFIAIDYYGFGEEHLLPLFLINISGTALIMIPLKLILILIVIYLLDTLYKEEQNNFKEKEIKISKYRLKITAFMINNFYLSIKVLIFILGFGPGFRNTLLPSLF
ncbi:MAG: hypothetical protein APG08_00455 [Candidatus Methanofastidiosum methylothiophilum]|jgi:uncharacterized membrane protein|uniref:DUF63 family protein n=1 Tax=Candidatus Methanofastidiosum methylothiophilum TaxID=1705564 RepID=A0A150JJ20_9EURY|nr:MAG: hypothetical protein AN188_00307 [Candidatus Methanofastidiosum methylthiophilus]MBP6931905.1 DUF63 family protein [Methanofastidiosum sp.]OQC52144.1 MAG: hypothetical protein BWX56_00511 [Euryarchaeota archaeon ADurb.Bin023]KYC57171.1 MAG: hypothetical protein APG08_00455 [Candidatus Methanofastidiosum methylthiophilus]KYC57927.1 MAG: hypothetical protein APG09_00814 [Candidatus Methanofastidiosum methylthiophilus]